MRSEISIKDYPNGWFGKHLRCAQGMDIYGWILEHAEEDQKKGAVICQQMLQKGLIQAVEDANQKMFNINNLYRFYCDRDDIADNLVKKFTGEARDPVELSKILVDMATEVYQQAVCNEEEEEGSDEEEGENIIDVEAALKSGEYKKYISQSK